jgi:hypothetical protein
MRQQLEGALSEKDTFAGNACSRAMTLFWNMQSKQWCEKEKNVSVERGFRCSVLLTRINFS